jgi:methyl-accepting chemotaxis protein
VFGVVLFPHLVLAGLAVTALRTVSGVTTEIEREFTNEMASAWRLDEALDGIDQALTGYNLNPAVASPAALRESIVRFQQVLGPIQASQFDDANQLEAFETIRQQASIIAGIAGKLLSPEFNRSRSLTALDLQLREAINAAASAVNRIQAVGLQQNAARRKRMADATRNITLELLIAAPLSMLAAGVLSVMLARSITRPIRALADGARRVAAGELTHRIGLGPGGELGQAIEAFNTMGERLQRAQTDLQARVRELEAATAEVGRLQELLPICAWCKKVRNDAGFWMDVVTYLQTSSTTTFTHGICSDCKRKVSPPRAPAAP